jgi:ABC-type dipeptide/oligopeptide/nickel transport system permease component
MSESAKRNLAAQFGLDKPLWQQYVIYIEQLGHGNLGVSFANREPVSQNLRTAITNTVPMVLLGLVVATVIGTITGVISAWRRGTLIDRASVTTAMILYSVPGQWLGLMLIILFAAVLPVGGMQNEFAFNPTPAEHAVDVLSHMTLPSLTLGLVLYGQYALIVRSSMLETLGEDYILVARAKGLSDWTVVWRHALRNALLPITTLLALSLGYIVAGAILIEVVFSWPGIGRAIYEAVLSRDYPMLQGAFLVLTCSVIFFNFVADLLYSWLDPRVAV